MSKYSTIDDIEQHAPLTVTYVGVAAWEGYDKPIECDLWRVTLTGNGGFWSTNYRTGLGLRKAGRPCKPRKADIMHSLISDASAADWSTVRTSTENFTDWCNNYGYSDDSICALNTYKACIETARALREHLDHDDLAAIAELLKDY